MNIRVPGVACSGVRSVCCTSSSPGGEGEGGDGGRVGGEGAGQWRQQSRTVFTVCSVLILLTQMIVGEDWIT